MQVRFAWRAALVTALAVACYSAALRNRYALDDDLVIGSNISVQRGVSGLGEIFSRDSYAGFYETLGAGPQLAGGRYRPLALATFAIEQSLLGKTLGDDFRRLGDVTARSDLLEGRMRDSNLALAPFRHAVSILLYALSMIVLLRFLERYLLPGQPGVALVTTVLFAVHPIHSEVVANVKSRDEILSLLFILLTLLFAFRYEERKRSGDFIASIAMLFLALLSKEYAVMMPLVLVVAITVARAEPASSVARRWLPATCAAVAAYAILRGFAAGFPAPTPLAQRDLINDPFLKLRLGEVDGDVLATKISILLHYLRLLVWPHPLSADYSYATFPYRGWADARVWLSVAVHVSIVAGTIYAWLRRHILAVAGFVYLAFLFPVSNLPFDIGATMGERLIYHASVGFCLAAGWALVSALRKPAVGIVTTSLVLVFGSLTFVRAGQWRDDKTLFLHDVKTVPNSVLANANAGSHLTEVALLLVRQRRMEGKPLSAADRAVIEESTAQALPYLQRAVSLHPRFANGWINLGLLYWTRNDYAAATEAWSRAATIFPSHPILRRYGTNFHLMGDEAARKGDLGTAIAFYERAARVLPGEKAFLRDVAGANFMAMRFGAARLAFDALLAADPADADAAQGRAAAAGLESLQREAERPEASREAVERFAAALDTNGHPAFRLKAQQLRSAGR